MDIFKLKKKKTLKPLLEIQASLDRCKGSTRFERVGKVTVFGENKKITKTTSKIYRKQNPGNMNRVQGTCGTL